MWIAWFGWAESSRKTVFRQVISLGCQAVEAIRENDTTGVKECLARASNDLRQANLTLVRARAGPPESEVPWRFFGVAFFLVSGGASAPLVVNGLAEIKNARNPSCLINSCVVGNSVATFRGSSATGSVRIRRQILRDSDLVAS